MLTAGGCAGLAALLQMLCTEFNHSHPEQSAACKQMAKASWNWVELLTGMLLWQHKELPLIRLKDLVNAAVKIRGQPRHTDREFQDFFQEVCAEPWDILSLLAIGLAVTNALTIVV